MKSSFYLKIGVAHLTIAFLGMAAELPPKDYLVEEVPLLNRSYKCVFSFDDIRKSPEWDPLDGSPCPLPVEKAIGIARKGIEAEFGSRVGGPVYLKLEMLPVSMTDGNTEFGRYCYVISFGIANIDDRNVKSGEIRSYRRVVAAVLLNGKLSNFVHGSVRQPQ